jgi:hypothetical protein
MVTKVTPGPSVVRDPEKKSPHKYIASIGLEISAWRKDAAIYTKEMAGLIGGEDFEVKTHRRFRLFSELPMSEGRLVSSAFMVSLALGYRRTEIEGVSLKELNDRLTPGLSKLIGDAIDDLDDFDAVRELGENGSEVADKQIASAVQMIETYADVGGTFLGKAFRFPIFAGFTLTTLEFGLGGSLHISHLKIVAEKNAHRATKNELGLGAELAFSVAPLTFEGGIMNVQFKPLVLDSRIMALFADGDFQGLFASAALTVQVAKYF